jgi:hypothetical protein
LQAASRDFLGRRQVRSLRMGQVITRLQSRWRGQSGRRDAASRLKHIIRSQSLWRSQLAQRESASRVRALRLQANLSCSAVRFQSLWRGRRVREVTKSRLMAVVRIQASWHCSTARRRFRRTLASILRLQATSRGLLVRRQVRALRLARSATRLQGLWRGQLARREFTLKRLSLLTVLASQTRMVIRLQRLWRSQLAKRRAAAFLLAASQLQGWWRRWKRRRAAIMVQSAWRGCQGRANQRNERAEMLHRRIAAKRLQLLWRRKVCGRLLDVGENAFSLASQRAEERQKLVFMEVEKDKRVIIEQILERHVTCIALEAQLAHPLQRKSQAMPTGPMLQALRSRLMVASTGELMATASALRGRAHALPKQIENAINIAQCPRPVSSQERSSWDLSGMCITRKPNSH